jgi:hypothetical protein
MVMGHLRQIPGASCDRRRGPLKGGDPVGRPRLPSREDCGCQPLGEGLLGKRGAHGFPCLLYLGFASATPGTSPLAVPIDHGQEALVPPLPPLRRQEDRGHILLHALPPAIHQRRQGRHWLTALEHGVGTGGYLMVLREPCNRLYRRLQVAFNLCGGLRNRVSQAEGMSRE